MLGKGKGGGCIDDDLTGLDWTGGERRGSKLACKQAGRQASRQ